MSFEEFAEKISPGIKQRYEFYMSYADASKSLIGRKVVSIRSGFSNSEGGTFMTITNIRPPDKRGKIWIELKPNEDTDWSVTMGKDRDHLGWLCELSELPLAVKPY